MKPLGRIDDQVPGMSREIPQGINTSTGQHCIQESLFAPNAVVSPQNPTGSIHSHGKYLIRAILFANVETDMTDPPHQQEAQQKVPPPTTSKQAKRVFKQSWKVSNRCDRLQTANELFADQEVEAQITN